MTENTKKKLAILLTNSICVEVPESKAFSIFKRFYPDSTLQEFKMLGVNNQKINIKNTITADN